MSVDREERRRAWLLLAGVVAVWCAYIAYRTWMQRLHPSWDSESYLVQDGWISLGRALNLGLCAGLCAWAFGGRAFRGALPATAPVLALGIALPLLHWLPSYPSLGPSAETPRFQALELLIALLVAANEEVGFRIGLLGSARRLWGDGPALLLNAAAFGAMHIGYQPLGDLLKNAVMGLYFSLLFYNGLGLAWLIALHFAIDALDAVSRHGADDWPLVQLRLALLLGGCLWLWLSWKRRQALLA